MIMEKRIRVIIGKTSLDGHWRGVQAVATALRDAGMEVIYVGMSTAETTIRVALQEDADVIGLNVGASYSQIEKMMSLLKENNMDNVLVILGGVIPLADIPKLKAMGVDEVFPPGSKLRNIVKYVRENIRDIK
jgi:methylmalonyl-CoA mutase, C-terminal domain